ncbi:MAG: DUF6320 domain-containing protein [Bacilli bacterium]|jgi:hypothetical protein
MKYCNRCRVVIENNLINCPLCKQKLLKRNETPENDFPIQKAPKEDTGKRIMKLLVFIFIALIGANVVLNLSFSFKLIWAPYSIVALFYAYLLIRAAMKSYKNIGTIVMLNVSMLSIISLILDIILGFTRWSLNYAIPIIILAGTIALVIFTCIRPTRFLAYFIYMLMIALFGLTMLILLWARLVTVKAPSIITAFVSLMVIIGMFIFGDKKTENEFVKRFHF